MTRQNETTPGVPRFAVREDGLRVVVEITMPTHYDAIHLAEVIAAGLREGAVTLTLGDHACVE